MKFCGDHWEKLKQAIKDRGLWHLVSATGDEAIEALTSQMQEGHFDPLAVATIRIYGAAIEDAGLAILATKEDGSEYCPLCEARAATDRKEMVGDPQGHFHGDENWINGCADEMLDLARQLWKMPPVQ